MDNIHIALDITEYVLMTKRRRHIVGGILISMSALFAGLAITTLTIDKEEEINNE